MTPNGQSGRFISAGLRVRPPLGPPSTTRSRYAPTVSPSTRKEIPGQFLGYWLEPGRPVAAIPTGIRETGAVLRRLDDQTSDNFECLDLVLVDAAAMFIWMPLSDAGRYTYAHSSGLLRGEPWRFAARVAAGWVEYLASYSSSLQPSQLLFAYGAEAQARARRDIPAVQLRLRAIPTA